MTFTFVVKNTTTEEPVTITSLKTVSMARWLAMTTARSAPSWLLAQAVSSPSPSGWKATTAGPDHVNVFTAKAEDNDNTEATDDDDATVDFTNVLPTIQVTKTANPMAVPETGGDVTFTFVVKNTSTEEPVTITSLKTVSMARWLAMTTARSAPSWLRAQPASSPSPSGWKATTADPITSTSSPPRRKTTTAPKPPMTTMRRWTSPMCCPTIEVTKTADPTAVPETGGDVTFTFVVKNTSTEEPVTITSLEDSVYGTLAGDDDCKVGTVLAAGASCEFSFTKWVEGDYSGTRSRQRLHRQGGRQRRYRSHR